METAVLLAVLIFAAAILYSSVGHAGASGYLAAMALVGVAPDVMKPTALALNILVASIATVRFYRAGYFYWAAFWPFVIGSVPLAFVGGGHALEGRRGGAYPPIGQQGHPASTGSGPYRCWAEAHAHLAENS